MRDTHGISSNGTAPRRSRAASRRGPGPASIVALALLACASAGPAGGAVQGIAAVRVAAGLASLTYAAAPAGDTRLFVVERLGTIRILEHGVVRPTPFLDVSSLTTTSGGERGLLGLAFAPDYATSGLFYVNYTAASDHPDSGAGVDEGDTVIDRFAVSGDPHVADAGSRTTILTVEQPGGNHNGGTLAFGDDGMLWVAMGDGGGTVDLARARPQDGTTLHGKMLRIDVAGPPDAPKNYGIPDDNPFVGAADPADEILDEIWSFGFRNPFRWSFDRETGDLYIGDVGQNTWEEVNVEAADDAGGRNYGWACKEGTGDFTDPPENCPPDSAFTPPVHEYPQSSGGCAVTGGNVYRGDAMPRLRGTYFFADFCLDSIWSFVWDGAGGVTDFRDRTLELTPHDGSTIDSIVGFGEDGSGELYILDLGGEVFKIVPDGLQFFIGDD